MLISGHRSGCGLIGSRRDSSRCILVRHLRAPGAELARLLAQTTEHGG